MIVNQLALSVANGVLNGVQLLRKLKAGPLCLDHANKRAQMPLGALEADNNIGMTGVFHPFILSRGRGYGNYHDDWLIDLQGWLYGGMAEGLKSAHDVSALPALLASAVLFGALHALMPGHGKSVLVSYHLGRDGRMTDGLLTGLVLALTHVGSAVVFVMAGVAVISRTLAAAGHAPPFERASAILIIATGIFLLWRLLRPHEHPNAGDGKALAFFTGLIPCPLTTFILTYALAKHQLAVGFAAVVAMTVGLIVTIASFAVAAVVVRGRFMALVARSEGLRLRIGRAFELAGACAVIILGLLMLAR